MQRARVGGVELEYEVVGSGEPVLLISPVVAGAFIPFLFEPALTDRYRLIRYHKRGWGGSTHPTSPVSIEDHADDAAGLLTHVGVDRAHIVGHSSGGSIALQLAADYPDRVHTLAVLEPSLLSVPSARGLLDRAAPAFAAYAGRDPEAAVAAFLSVVSGLAWDTCRALLEEHAPGSVGDVIRDAETFFGAELPALAAWEFGPDQAARITQPVLSLLGSETESLWVEVAVALRDWLPQVEQRTVNGVGHLLQMQRPDLVAREVRDFLAGHPMTLPTNASRVMVSFT